MYISRICLSNIAVNSCMCKFFIETISNNVQLNTNYLFTNEVSIIHNNLYVLYYCIIVIDFCFKILIILVEFVVW